MYSSVIAKPLLKVNGYVGGEKIGLLEDEEGTGGSCGTGIGWSSTTQGRFHRYGHRRREGRDFLFQWRQAMPPGILWWAMGPTSTTMPARGQHRHRQNAKVENMAGGGEASFAFGQDHLQRWLVVVQHGSRPIPQRLWEASPSGTTLLPVPAAP